ncbi:MAG: hypothetical protein FJX68_01450 [Alphaproteobacteria bacterium]|nr:hypothetical protein [Alphaproteobacteria bacterium]
MIASTRNAETLQVGSTLPVMTQSFTIADLVAYGAATWDWHRMHYDQEFARARKFPNVMVDGQCYGAVMAKHALAWAGPRAFVRRLKFRMLAMTFAGDSLQAEAEVAEVRDEPAHAVVVLASRLKNGAKLTAEGTIELRMPK